MDTYDQNVKTVTALLADLFEISAYYRQGADSVAFSLSFRFERKRSLKLLKDRLKTAGYTYQIEERPPDIILTVDPKPRLRIPAINIILFLATLFTVYFVPVFLKRLGAAQSFTDALDQTLSALAGGEGLEFTLAMISILFVHEMGHYIASRRRNIITSLPFFIPAPNIIGTFGAVIKSKSPFWNRRDLIEVGAAGPIAGWIVAVGWLLYGLSQSTIVPAAAFEPVELAFSMEGESILMRLITDLILGSAPADHYYRLTEAAFAGWVGLLVTAINMLPIGQLDGGHVLYGLARKRQHLAGMIATGGLILFGIQSTMWWLFAAFGLFFGMKHPPTLNDSLAPEPHARLMGIIALVILVISFTPVPFR